MKYTIPLIILLILTSCTTNILTIDNNNYKIENNHLQQLTNDDDKIATFAVFSDIHGHTDNFKLLLEKTKDIDSIIILGDTAEHFREKPDKNRTDYDEIYTTLLIASNTNLPIFIIPGNHDLKEPYYKVIQDINKKNIIDMSIIRTFDGDDFDLISNPYGDDFTYPKGSFQTTEENFNELINKINKDNSPDILISHQPPKGNSINDIDVIRDRTNVGSNKLNNLIIENAIRFVFAGHIHEAGAKAVNLDGPLQQNTFSYYARLNPGSVMPWLYLDNKTRIASAAIVTINDSRMKYKIIN
jgi:Icc-related predicted phosphoesterase